MIEATIIAAVAEGGGRRLDHYGDAVGTHAYGLFLHTGIVVDVERPDGISAEL